MRAILIVFIISLAGAAITSCKCGEDNNVEKVYKEESYERTE